MFDFMFTVVPIIVVAGFIFVFGSIIYNATKNLGKPLLSREARVIAKRTKVWGHDHARTTYFVTFELPDGNREELRVAHDQFGYLVEGDRGILRSQGDSIQGFDRYIERG